MNVNGKSRANKIRVAYVESKGHHVHMLPCGAFGSTRGLFNLAKSIGFDGTENTFWQRLKRAGGSMTLAELAVPANKVHATTKRRTQSDDVAAAIAALDARKAAMR
jgi:hypothetical protein